MLLIFFMVTTVLREYSGLPISLPKAKRIEKLKSKRHTSHIWVSKDGLISIDDRLFNIEDISKVIFSNEAIIAVLITGILGTTFALLVMIWAQKILSASETAVIIAMEPVFAALFSVYFGYEVLGLLSYLGALIVVFAIIFCELSRSNKLVS